MITRRFADFDVMSCEKGRILQDGIQNSVQIIMQMVGTSEQYLDDGKSIFKTQQKA
jgi:hypothetical protein